MDSAINNLSPSLSLSLSRRRLSSCYPFWWLMRRHSDANLHVVSVCGAARHPDAIRRGRITRWARHGGCDSVI